MNKLMQLGGNIELRGFSDLKGSEMVVVKKIVGNYARRMEGMCRHFNGLKLSVKPLHGDGKFEIHGQLVDDGQVYPAEIIEHNLYVGVDSVLKKLVNGIS